MRHKNKNEERKDKSLRRRQLKMKMEENNKEEAPNIHASASPYAAHATGTHLSK
jgi:hypothetical protein